ncbi:hypothetical protein AN946_03335 [Trueperella pyogenes]|nr:hypothetical protein AN946_03335 [Trueperella pyogenes]
MESARPKRRWWEPTSATATTSEPWVDWRTFAGRPPVERRDSISRMRFCSIRLRATFEAVDADIPIARTRSDRRVAAPDLIIA